MITIKYKGEVIDPKDIEITWVEFYHGFIEKTGDVEDYAQSKYSEGFEDGFNEGSYADA
jgi:hypothetical protein